MSTGRLIVDYEKDGRWLTCLGDDGDDFDAVVCAIKRVFPDVIWFRPAPGARYECTCGWRWSADVAIEVTTLPDTPLHAPMPISCSCLKCGGVAVLQTRGGDA